MRPTGHRKNFVAVHSYSDSVTMSTVCKLQSWSDSGCRHRPLERNCYFHCDPIYLRSMWSRQISTLISDIVRSSRPHNCPLDCIQNRMRLHSARTQWTHTTMGPCWSITLKTSSCIEVDNLYRYPNTVLKAKKKERSRVPGSWIWFRAETLALWSYFCFPRRGRIRDPLQTIVRGIFNKNSNISYEELLQASETVRI